MRWSDRQPLKRDEGMATNQGMTLNTQPWRNNTLTYKDMQIFKSVLSNAGIIENRGTGISFLNETNIKIKLQSVYFRCYNLFGLFIFLANCRPNV